MNPATVNKLVRLRDEADLRIERRTEKRRELARHAIFTLGRLGYARTGLRDIAEQSGVSVGVLHYYFTDKIDLITFCVHLYKDEFVADLEAILARSDTPGAAAANVIDGLVKTVTDNASTHTLWYDISAQSLFDPAFRPVVSQIEDALVSVCANIGAKLKLDLGGLELYQALDGIFRYYLGRRIAAAPASLEDMRTALTRLLAR